MNFREKFLTHTRTNKNQRGIRFQICFSKRISVAINLNTYLAIAS